MSNTDEALKIWDALKPMIDREIESRTRSCVRATKMSVTDLPVFPETDAAASSGVSEGEEVEPVAVADNPTAGEREGETEEEEKPFDRMHQIHVGVTEPYGTQVAIPTGTQFSNVELGDAVWVYWYYNNASTMHIALNGNGTPGSGDIQALKAELAAAKSDLNITVNNSANYLLSEIAQSASGLYSQITITESLLRTEFGDAVNNVYSSITQTASQIRAEVHTGQSELYSYIEMTASYIRSEVGSVESGLYSSIEQTASQIRASVSASNSSLYAYVLITASNIKTEIVDSMSGIYSSVIEQTASYIRTEVSSSLSSISSTIEQNQAMIVSAVGSISRIDGQLDTIEGSAIWQSKSQIANLVGALKYQNDYFVDSEGTYRRVWDSSTQSYIYVEAEPSWSGTRYRMERNLHVQEGVGMKIDKREGNQSVSYGFYNQDNLTAGAIVQMINGQSQYTILADRINLQGYVTASNLATEIAAIQQMVINGYLDVNGFAHFNEDVYFHDSVSGPGAQFDVIYFGSEGANDIVDAVKTVGPATESNGQITIPWATFRGAQTPINFNIAATQTYLDGVAAAEASVTATMSRTNRGYDSSNNSYFITSRATLTNGNYASATYSVAGPTVSSVSPGTPVWDSSTGTYTIPVTVTLSNGYTDTQSAITITPTDAINSVNVDLNNTSIINEYWQGRSYMVDVLIKLTNGNQSEFVGAVYP